MVEHIAADEPGNERSADLVGRLACLRKELEATIEHYRRRVRRLYQINVTLMTLTILASTLAGIAGLTGFLGAKAVGVIALVPAYISLFATTLKLQGKGNSHYRRKDALQLLRRRLIYEIPLNPTETDVKEISRAWSVLTDRMNDEWEQSLQFDWAHFPTGFKASPSGGEAVHKS
jgi:hypothetical protein